MPAVSPVYSGCVTPSGPTTDTVATGKLLQGQYFPTPPTDFALEQSPDLLALPENYKRELAIINQKLGETDAMMENLRLARRHSRGAEQERFSGKLQTPERILSSSQ